MSEPNIETSNTPEQAQSVPASSSIINQAVEKVMYLIDALNLYSLISRGALGTGNGLVCEVAPSSPSEVYLDKNQYITVDLTINGKHSNLETLSDAMNTIHESLTMLREYPYSTDWQIVDIVTLTEPQVIGREENNDWIMASSLGVKVLTMK
ncbi:MAG: hypothetical protein J6X83_04410 [Methanomicrobium sp.]|nr:hypothetical protein [Kiritimatiellia bacterium]MBP5475478.1 hypothetical protein [Methanomicrobium sp.]